MAGTLIQAISYGSILLGALAAQSEGDLAAGPAFALGFGLVPLVFVAVAIISRRQNAPASILKAMGAWLVFALPLGLFNPVTGLVAGFSAGGALTLRPPAMMTKRWRARAAILGTIYVTGLVLIVPRAGIFAGAVTPLLVIRAADVYAEKTENTNKPGES